jgi:hypothetical protein
VAVGAEGEMLALKRFMGPKGGGRRKGSTTDATVTLVFPAPEEPGLSHMDVHVVSDSMRGIDFRLTIALWTVEAPHEEAGEEGGGVTSQGAIGDGAQEGGREA